MNFWFEKILAFHCAPTLAGIKPANLISCSKEKNEDVLDVIKKCNDEIGEKGVSIEVLFECEKRILVLVYRKNMLEKYIDNKKTHEILKETGYGENKSVSELIEYLKHRIKLNNGFPHEIGLFLGYPPEDVIGFIEKKDCKLTGYWKVYSNVENTKKLFEKYSKCRTIFCKKIENGVSIGQLTKAA